MQTASNGRTSRVTSVGLTHNGGANGLLIRCVNVLDQSREGSALRLVADRDRKLGIGHDGAETLHQLLTDLVVGADDRELVEDLVAMAGEDGRGGNPVPSTGPRHSFPPAGLDIEARALAPKGRRLVPKLWILLQLALNIYSDKTGRSLGRFNAARYKRDVANNSDFRKFDDGLKMTIDVDASTFSRIEQRLMRAERNGVCRYGLHNQKSALMTCIVATPLEQDHIHFVDGAAGGYAMAAMNLKSKYAA